MVDEIFKYETDYIDAYCERVYGHTNWQFAKSTDANVDVTIIIFKKPEKTEEL